MCIITGTQPVSINNQKQGWPRMKFGVVEDNRKLTEQRRDLNDNFPIQNHDALEIKQRCPVLESNTNSFLLAALGPNYIRAYP